MQTATLQTTNLACERGGRFLFNNLNITLNAGELLQVLGRNGCGKTSLLRILTGLLTPQQGKIHWCGRLIQECGAEYRQAFCYLGHKNAIKASLTVLEHLQLHTYLRQQQPPADLSEILHRFSLWPLRYRRGETLSAGQRQRLALARLALTPAPLWILDEPFTALDTQGIENGLQMMAQHVAQGGMVVFTSHQPLTWQSTGFKQISLG
ncbi:MAG: cytochrome c biogenesis heme-transporting ATPase CcmA [Gammaproteobacteria bacterium]